jgi:hypothetical protein
MWMDGMIEMYIVADCAILLRKVPFEEGTDQTTQQHFYEGSVTAPKVHSV